MKKKPDYKRRPLPVWGRGKKHKAAMKSYRDSTKYKVEKVRAIVRRRTPTTAQPLLPHFFLRQTTFYDPLVQDPHITIVGAGGIGSWVVFQLAKLGVRRMTVYDKDTVAPHNLSTTPYTVKDIGKSKAQAIADLAVKYGATVTVKEEMVNERTPLPDMDILISAVDNIQARRVLYAKGVVQEIPFYVDGRIGGENLRVYAIDLHDKEDRKTYEASVDPKLTVSELPCGAQQVIDVGWTTASHITRAVRKWLVDRAHNPEVIVDQQTLDTMVAPMKQITEEQLLDDAEAGITHA